MAPHDALLWIFARTTTGSVPPTIRAIATRGRGRHIPKLADAQRAATGRRGASHHVLVQCRPWHIHGCMGTYCGVVANGMRCIDTVSYYTVTHWSAAQRVTKLSGKQPRHSVRLSSSVLAGTGEVVAYSSKRCSNHAASGTSAPECVALAGGGDGGSGGEVAGQREPHASPQIAFICSHSVAFAHHESHGPEPAAASQTRSSQAQA